MTREPYTRIIMDALKRRPHTTRELMELSGLPDEARVWRILWRMSHLLTREKRLVYSIRQNTPQRLQDHLPWILEQRAQNVPYKVIAANLAKRGLHVTPNAIYMAIYWEAKREAKQAKLEEPASTEGGETGQAPAPE